MSLGTSGWGLMSLAKRPGWEARKGGCGEAEIRCGLERKSGARLIFGLGRGLGPETQRVDHALVRQG